TSKIEALQSPISSALEVVDESRRVTDLDESSLAISDLKVGASDVDVTKPVYLPGYRSWEHAIGHHDELTDIFSIGMLLASVACGLDFTDSEELEVLAANRSNLFAVNRRLNQDNASVIITMTELYRLQQ